FRADCSRSKLACILFRRIFHELRALTSRRFLALSRQKVNMAFKLVCDYVPQGDQPQAIEQLVRGIHDDLPHQVLLGVTGSGKTFTMAAVIERINRPVLVMAHNKTLAATLHTA